ncbi:hypothetical protein BJ546DRAFT_641870 [Cryomyces antarcticus]
MPAPGDQHQESKATINPFEEITPRVNEYTAQEIATLQSRLDRQLGPEYISTRPGSGGSKVHYLAAEKVINLANEVFGFNGWSSGIQNVQIDFVDESASTGKITLGLSIIMRITLKDGTFHEDIGYGHIENCKGKAAAFEKAKKEAATDALKRALRNFGNVLGNCLYDKDYLARVTKLKIAPSKWDAENLHRHPEYAPIKKEALNEMALSSGNENRPQGMPSLQSNPSTEFEDEFGGNVFDEVDFSHPDEVVLDASITDASIDNTATAPNARHQVSRVQSMPVLRPPNSVQHPQHPQHGQQPQRPQQPLRGPQTPNGNANAQLEAGRRRMLPPHANANQPLRPAQAQPLPPQTGPNLEQQGPRSNSSSASDSAAQAQSRAPPQDRQNENPAQKITPPYIMQAPLPEGHEPPVGFITSRAAELLKNPSDPLPNGVPAFNPHAESPSIRRTHGVNPGKSAPVSRTALSAPQPLAAPLTGNVDGAATTNIINNNSGNANGTAPPPRTNFVNPAADAGRRIGMPGAGVPSPLANRSAYKPPSVKRPAPADAAARPPLADVSNVVSDGAADSAGGRGGDAKRAKLSGAQNGAQNGAAVSHA